MRPAAAPVCAAALLAGCVTADQSQGLQAAYADCVAAAVARMDDGRTDPVSLAYGIAPMCAVQYNRLTEANAGAA